MKANSLKYIVSITVVAVIVLPIFIIFYVYPSFEGFIVQLTEKKAVLDARHLAHMFFTSGKILTTEAFPQNFSQLLEDARQDFNLYKVKVFSPDGIVQYSSDPLDIGHINQEAYFHEKVSRGELFAKVVEKNSHSLEGELVRRDVVEIYVPFMKGDEFLGAFEIYYDITPSKQDLGQLIFRSSVALFVIVLFLLLAVIVSSFIAGQSQLKQKELEGKLLEASITDELTGLYNRRGFMELAGKQLKVAERTKEEIFLLFADFDKLKWINDNLGHKAGDQALSETALILQDTFRQADVIGRLSGDEFVVLLTAKEGHRDEHAAIDRLLHNLQERNKQANKNYDLELSVGSARQNHDDPYTLDEMLTKADTGMYEVKKKKESKDHIGNEASQPNSHEAGDNP